MVKRREPASVKRKPTIEEIEAFASGADCESVQQKQKGENLSDPNAKRKYKAIRVPFNEYEYLKLQEAASKTGRTKLNFIRWAILKLAEEVQERS